MSILPFSNWSISADKVSLSLDPVGILKRLETAQYSPVLYKQLTDPTFAALAYDNIDNLEGLEKLFNDLIIIYIKNI